MKHRFRKSCYRHFITKVLIFTSSVCLCHSQPKNLRNITFLDIDGRAYSNITVLMIEKDGIMFRYGEEYRYDRVKFTNMGESVQVIFG